MNRRVALAAAALLIALAAAFPVLGKPRVRYRQGWAAQPWARYAAMAGPACLAELARRGVRAAPVDRAPGVRTPVRLPEGAGGVVYRTEAPAHVRARLPGEVLDCRLALALTDLSAIVRARGVAEVVILSAWRPRPDALAHAGPPGRPELRHPGGLAVDVLRFGKGAAEAEGEGRVWLDVERDFGGAIGAPVCPGGRGQSGAGRELRAIVCEAAARHLFTSILTPNYDRAHKNHLHLEVTPGVQWELLR